MSWQTRGSKKPNWAIPTAQALLGATYHAAHDYAQALAWFRKAADQGGALGQYNIGRMYHFGQGVQRDDALAAFWFRKAAEQGNTFAQIQLASLHDRSSRRAGGLIGEHRLL